MNVMACLEYAVKELRVGKTAARRGGCICRAVWHQYTDPSHAFHTFARHIMVLSEDSSLGAVLLHAQVRNIICCGHYGCGERPGMDLSVTLDCIC